MSLEVDGQLILDNETSSTMSVTSTDSDTPESEDNSVMPVMAHEESVATQLVDAAIKVKRLMKVKAMMEQSPFFDNDDVRRIDDEMQAVEQTADTVRQTVSKQQWTAVRMFITLKHREIELEAAVGQQLLLPDQDGELFQGLVKKQVYLTRLAMEAIE